MPTSHESFNTLVYQTLEAAAALLEAGRPAEALHAIRVLAEMEITARQREQYIALRREIEAQLVHDSWVTLQLAHPEPLTFALLTDEVIPYLQAVHRVHEVVARLQSKPPSWDPEIRQLSHHSPLSVTFGYWHPDIIQAILDTVNEERRGPARRIRAGESPSLPMLTRVDTTYQLLEKVIPSASAKQKNALATQLLPDIDLLASSPVEAQIIGVSVQPGAEEPPSAKSSERGPAKPSAAAPGAKPPEALPEETVPPTQAPPERSTPRYIGGQHTKPEPPARTQYPRHRVTRPAPKPYSPPSDEDEGGDSEEGAHR